MADIETTAREMGWRPKEEFRGESEKWVDAETFVSRGEHFLPIVRADRERLRAQVTELQAKLGTVEQTLAASAEALEELKQFNSENTRRQVEQARKDLVKQLKEARESGDVEAETAVLDQLDEVRAAQKKATAEPPAKPATPATPATPTAVQPEQAAWQEANPWFTSSPRLRGTALGIAEELRANPATAKLTGKAFFDKLSEEMAPYLNPEDRPTSKVGGGRPSGTRSAGGPTERTYADLSADERAACDRQAKKLVGPGRAFKTEADWQAYFIKEIGETA